MFNNKIIENEHLVIIIGGSNTYIKIYESIQYDYM